jgi:hypothetical protein
MKEPAQWQTLLRETGKGSRVLAENVDAAERALAGEVLGNGFGAVFAGAFFVPPLHNLWSFSPERAAEFFDDQVSHGLAWVGPGLGDRK